MDQNAIADVVARAVGRYDRSDDATDPFFDEQLRVLAPEGDAAIDAALPFLRSEVVSERCAGAEIVGRAGEANSGSVAGRAYDLLFAILVEDPDQDVREAVSAGIGLLWLKPEYAGAALSLIRNPNVNVRYAAAVSLALTTTDAAGQAAERTALEQLKADGDEDARGWAEFGLETLTF